jgi:hypothetical protein
MRSKFLSGLAIAAIASSAFVGVAFADADGGIDTASGGNGGVSTANASGGSVGIGATNTGGDSGGSVSAAIDAALFAGDDIAAAVIASILGDE